MLGHELLAHDDVVARGALEPHRVPGVDDLVLAGRALEDEQAHLGRAARRAGPLDRGEQEIEVAVEGAARKLPVSVEHVAAVGRPRDCAPRRPARRRDPRVAHGIPAVPEPLLRLGREVREDQLVHRVVLVHPGRARTAAPELGRHADVGGEVELVAAVGARLQDPEQARVLELADRLLGHAALALAALRALAQPRHQRARACDQLVDTRLAGFVRSDPFRHGRLLVRAARPGDRRPARAARTVRRAARVRACRRRSPPRGPRSAARSTPRGPVRRSTRSGCARRTPGTSGAAFGHHAAFGFGVKQSAIAIGDFSIAPGRNSRVSHARRSSSEVSGRRSVHTSTMPG